MWRMIEWQKKIGGLLSDMKIKKLALSFENVHIDPNSDLKLLCLIFCFDIFTIGHASTVQTSK